MAPTGAFSSYNSSSKKLKLLLSSWILLFSYFVVEISASSVNDCRGVKYAYSQKGLDQSDVPRQPRQGKIYLYIFLYFMKRGKKIKTVYILKSTFRKMMLNLKEMTKGHIKNENRANLLSYNLLKNTPQIPQMK